MDRVPAQVCPVFRFDIYVGFVHYVLKADCGKKLFTGEVFPT